MSSVISSEIPENTRLVFDKINDNIAKQKQVPWNGRRIGLTLAYFGIFQLVGLVGIPLSLYQLAKAAFTNKNKTCMREGKVVNARKRHLMGALGFALNSLLPIIFPALVAYGAAKASIRKNPDNPKLLLSLT